MKLAVEVSNKSIILDVDSNDRIKLLKYLIRERKSIEISDQVLLFGNKVLKDRLKLADYEEIMDGSAVRVVLADDYYRESGTSNDIKVTVNFYEKDKEKTAFEVETKLSDTVKDLKARIESKMGFQAVHQMLRLDGGLEHDRALSDYDIRNGSTLSLSMFYEFPTNNSFDIFVKLANGRMLCQQINTYFLVSQLVKLIRESKGEEAGRMLVLKGFLLQQVHSLYDYYFEEDSTLDMINELPPGSMMIGVKFLEKEENERRSIRLRSEVLSRTKNLTTFDYLSRFFVLIVKSNERIRDVKTAIEVAKSAVAKLNQNPNIVASQLVLKPLNDLAQEMDDERTLSDYGLKNGSVIGVVYKLPIAIKSYDDGRVLKLEVRSNETAREIEAEVEKHWQIPAVQQTISNSCRNYNDFTFKLIRYLTIQELTEGARSVFGIETTPVLEIRIAAPSSVFVEPLEETLDVKSTNTIRKVKRKIESKYGVPYDEQRLSFEGKQLADGHTLAYYNVPDGSTLYLICKVNNLKLSVKAFDDQTYDLQVEFDDTVEVVKSRMEQHLNLGEQLILSLGEEQLDDYRTLSSYRIGEGSVLNLGLNVIDLEVYVKTECVEKRLIKIKSSCSIQELKEEIKRSDLSICKENDLALVHLGHYPNYKAVVYKEENALILGRNCRIKNGTTLLARQDRVCERCEGCAKIKQFEELI